MVALQEDSSASSRLLTFSHQSNFAVDALATCLVIGKFSHSTSEIPGDTFHHLLRASDRQTRVAEFPISFQSVGFQADSNLSGGLDEDERAYSELDMKLSIGWLVR